MSKQKPFKTQTVELGEVIIEPRGKRQIYSVSFYHNGSHKRRTLKSSNKTEALKNLETVLLEFRSTTAVQSPPSSLQQIPPSAEQLSLREGAEIYLESLRVNNCSARNVRQVETRINTFIDFANSKGVYNINDVKPTHADEFYSGLIRGSIDSPRKKKKSINTAVGYVRFTKTCYEYLESRSLIPSNPWKKIHYSRVSHRRTRIPTLEELNKILENLEPEYRIAATALALMGCRGEALTRIEPQHVKLEDGYILIKPPEHRSKTIERKVPIHPRLMTMLKGYDRPDSSYFFCTLRSSRVKSGEQMSIKNLNNAIKRAAKAAGFPAGRDEDGFVAHSLRGFLKSHCIKQRIPREVVDLWQGHRADNSVGTRHYFDLSLKDSIEFMQSVDFGP